MALLRPRGDDCYVWLPRNAYFELAGFAYDLALQRIASGEPFASSELSLGREYFRNLVAETFSQALEWYGYHSGVLLEPVFPRGQNDRVRFHKVVEQVSKWESRRKQLRSHGTAQREAGRYE